MNLAVEITDAQKRERPLAEFGKYCTNNKQEFYNPKKRKYKIRIEKQRLLNRKSLGIIMAKERELTIEEQGKSRKVLSKDE